VSVMTASMVAPTPVTRTAVRLMILIILLSMLFLVVQYPSLPWLLPVHFKPDGVPNGWQYKTAARVLMPVLVQLALALTLGAITALLLSRNRSAHDDQAPDVRAAAAAAEAVTLIAVIWVAFQGYAAVALVRMWMTERGGLGPWYIYAELFGLVLTGIVAARAHAHVGRPAPRPFVPHHWRFGELYANPSDPALFVPTRDGSRWTLNFGRSVAVALLGFIIAIGIIGPTVILGLALR